ncbi:MAG TPA: sulfotransferase [Verrucomicrobiae bacterium]
MMPIFMIGTQRSGSNLLRLMLNQLPNSPARPTRLSLRKFRHAGSIAPLTQ